MTVLARHAHQGDAAAACGADHVVLTDPNNGHFEELAHIVGVRQVGMGNDTMLMGGFPYVVEAVGAAQIDHRGPARRRPPGDGAAPRRRRRE